VCVCVREREREKQSIYLFIFLKIGFWLTELEYFFFRAVLRELDNYDV